MWGLQIHPRALCEDWRIECWKRRGSATLEIASWHRAAGRHTRPTPEFIMAACGLYCTRSVSPTTQRTAAGSALLAAHAARNNI